MASTKRKSRVANNNNPSEGNEKNKRLKRRETEEGEKTSVNFLTLYAKYISVLIVLVIIAIYIQVQSYEKQAEVTSEATILHACSETVLEFFEYQQKMINFLSGESISDLIKFKIQPIHERVTSLRTQTSQYEKMDKIPGGPKSFITSTLTELMSLRNQVYSLDSEVIKIKADGNIRKMSLSKTALNAVVCNHRLDDLFSEETYYLFQELAQHGIDVYPLEAHEYLPDIPDIISSDSRSGRFILPDSLALPQGVTPLELADKLEMASELFARKAMLKKKMVEAFISRGGNMDTDGEEDVFNMIMGDPELMAVDVEYGEVSDGIVELVKENGKYLNATMSWIYESSQVLARLLVGVVGDMDKSEPYLDLRNIVMQDILTLRTRVENLQYKYFKVKENPLLKFDVNP